MTDARSSADTSPGPNPLANGDASTAIPALRAAVAHAPHDAESWSRLGSALATRGDDDGAEAAFRRALTERPFHAVALCNLCDLLLRKGEKDAALALAASATAADPANPSFWFTLGHLRLQRDDLDAAREALARSAELLPGYAPTHQNLGLVLEWLGDFNGAERHFREAIALSPHNVDARFGLGTVLLKGRRGAEGWGLYAQGSRPQPGARRRIPARPWDGQRLDGTLLVDADQGLGDVLQFMRFAAPARARCKRLIVFCDDYFAPIRPLLASSTPIDAIVDRRSGAQRVDATCLASELPALLALGNAAFEPIGPYLAAPAERVRAWAARVATLRRPRVGLCWSGNRRAGVPDAARLDGRRSIPADRLRPLLDVPDVAFVSLQKGAAREDVAALGPALVDWTDALGDFAETAALMAALDLVISVDTSIVHAAGAVGAPVWMLDRFDNCWRWGTDPEHPGWYSQLRVFRQPAFGDWDSAIAAMRIALAQWARDRASTTDR